MKVIILGAGQVGSSVAENLVHENYDITVVDTNAARLQELQDRLDLRTVVADIPAQDLITRDNVPAKVNAVTYFRVIDAASSVVAVERYLAATSQIASCA